MSRELCLTMSDLLTLAQVLGRMLPADRRAAQQAFGDGGGTLDLMNDSSHPGASLDVCQVARRTCSPRRTRITTRRRSLRQEQHGGTDGA